MFDELDSYPFIDALSLTAGVREVLNHLSDHKLLDGFLDLHEKYATERSILEMAAKIGDVQIMNTLLRTMDPSNMDRKEVSNALMMAVFEGMY